MEARSYRRHAATHALPQSLAHAASDRPGNRPRRTCLTWVRDLPNMAGELLALDGGVLKLDMNGHQYGIEVSVSTSK